MRVKGNIKLSNQNADSNGDTGELCTCDHFAPNLRVLRSVAFNAELAAFTYRLAPSAGGVLDRVFEELYEHRTGQLFDVWDQEIDLEDVSGRRETALEKVFGTYPDRAIRHYRERCKRPHTNRLDHRMFLGVTLLFHAKQVWLCRSEGACAQRQAESLRQASSQNRHG